MNLYTVVLRYLSLTLPTFEQILILIFGIFLASVGFSLINKKRQAVKLAFCSMKKLFIRDIPDKSSIFNSPQYQDMGQKSDRVFPISEFLVNSL